MSSRVVVVVVVDCGRVPREGGVPGLYRTREESCYGLQVMEALKPVRMCHFVGTHAAFIIRNGMVAGSFVAGELDGTKVMDNRAIPD